MYAYGYTPFGKIPPPVSQVLQSGAQIGQQIALTAQGTVQWTANFLAAQLQLIQQQQNAFDNLVAIAQLLWQANQTSVSQDISNQVSQQMNMITLQQAGRP
jgi:hypothetical protein